MTNVKTRGRKIGRGDPRAYAMWRGYNEVMAGLPFDYSYVDRLNKGEGSAYENGRSLALMVKKRGLSLRWVVSDLFPAHLKNFRRIVMNQDLMNDEAPTVLGTKSIGPFRPNHLIKEDLRQELIARGLGCLAESSNMEVY